MAISASVTSFGSSATTRARSSGVRASQTSLLGAIGNPAGLWLIAATVLSVTDTDRPVKTTIDRGNAHVGSAGQMIAPRAATLGDRASAVAYSIERSPMTRL